VLGGAAFDGGAEPDRPSAPFGAASDKLLEFLISLAAPPGPPTWTAAARAECVLGAVADPPLAWLVARAGPGDGAEADAEEVPSLLAPGAAGPPNTSTGALKRTDQVRASITPEADMPCRRWNSCTAPWVCGPKIPSTAMWVTGRTSFSRLWADDTSPPWLPCSRRIR
jgi:hypothetical protein